MHLQEAPPLPANILHRASFRDDRDPSLANRSVHYDAPLETPVFRDPESAGRRFFLREMRSECPIDALLSCPFLPQAALDLKLAFSTLNSDIIYISFPF